MVNEVLSVLPRRVEPRLGGGFEQVVHKVSSEARSTAARRIFTAIDVTVSLTYAELEGCQMSSQPEDDWQTMIFRGVGGCAGLRLPQLPDLVHRTRLEERLYQASLQIIYDAEM